MSRKIIRWRSKLKRREFIDNKSSATFDEGYALTMFQHKLNINARVYDKNGVLKGSLKFYEFSERRGGAEQEAEITYNPSLVPRSRH